MKNLKPFYKVEISFSKNVVMYLVWLVNMFSELSLFTRVVSFLFDNLFNNPMQVF